MEHLIDNMRCMGKRLRVGLQRIGIVGLDVQQLQPCRCAVIDRDKINHDRISGVATCGNCGGLVRDHNGNS